MSVWGFGLLVVVTIVVGVAVSAWDFRPRPTPPSACCSHGPLASGTTCGATVLAVQQFT